MEPIFSMTSLQRNPSKVKEKAQESVVRITEHGEASFVFASEEAFEKRIAKEREEAAYEARLLDAVARGIADVEAGRTYSFEDGFAKARSMRRKHA